MAERQNTLPSVSVIGGGIIGISTALRLQENGFSVALFEKSSLHAATSANSHRIIHGGLRYLQSFDFRRLSRSLACKNFCLKHYPEYIQPLPCYLAIPEKGAKRSVILGLAGALYGAAAPLLGHPPEWTSISPIEEVRKSFPLLSRFPQKKVFRWTDAHLRFPSEFASHLMESFRSLGGSVHAQRKAISVERRERGYEILFESGAPVNSHLVVLALGPWFSELSVQGVDWKPAGWAKAFNLVLKVSPANDIAVGFTSTSGRVLFFSPRNESDGRCGLGTWYSPLGGDPDSLTVDDSEIEAALQEVNEALRPGVPLTASDVDSVEIGVLPMERMKRGDVSLYGSERIEYAHGIAAILSTKYTTFSSVADEIASWAKSQPLP
ncbi:MAG: FAD-dependent oxidoreductase [Bdellovibrionales bacterium]|nr:FAD-dependent oxidoreductase [Bdellovibrionales bacterium]